MPTREEIDRSCATFLRELRLSFGLSKVKMSDRLDTNRKRWASYETGENAPTISEYYWICKQMGVEPVPPILAFYEPEIYGVLHPDAQVSVIRRALAHYILNVATIAEVRSWHFQIFGHHGSDPRAQRAEEDMKNQLTLSQKYIIAEMVDAFWTLDKERGELRCTDEIKPDVACFRRALEAGRAATIEGRDGYSGQVR